MKVSLRWIQEFVDLPTTDVDELERVMSNLGLEVEGVEHVDTDFTGVVVGRVTEVAPHPNADKLRVATCDIGADEPHTVVCGAWNFDEGAVVTVALPGAVLPGGFEIGTREIRGVPSPGMICSERELGLGEDADGILVLDDDHPPLGADFADALPYPDVVFDLSITPNRPDAMSVHGVARDLAAHYDIDLRRPEITVETPGADTAITVRVEDPERCPRFTAREIRDIEIGAAPLWMRLRLRDAGMRPINNVVDITNYVMLEYGQPLHAFDLDEVPDETIVVRRAGKGERLTTLDSVDRALSTEDLVIAGPDEALALAGVMGGETSEVSEETSRILLEVAHFSAPHVLLTGKRHALRSEAVARFERGVDPELPPLASDRAAALMAEYAGGTVAGGFVDEYPGEAEATRVDLPADEVTRLLGVEIDPDTIAGYLERLGFTVERGDPMRVTVPSYRPDVSRPADLVEEVLRLHGFDAVPERVPHGPGGGLPDAEARRRAVRAAMVGAGYHETMSYAFVGPGDVEAMGYPDDDVRAHPVGVRNPLNEEEGVLRTTLLPGLLRGLRVNQTRNNPDVALFEMGRTFFADAGPLPHQPEHLAFATVGAVPGPAWSHGGEVRDWTDATGLVATLGEALGLDLHVRQTSRPGFHPGRCADVVLDGAVIGTVGEIHPRVAARFDVTGRVAAGELDLTSVLQRPPHRVFVTPSPYPPVVFDLAFDLPAEVPAADLVRAVRDAGGEHLERAVLFDVFTGPPLEQGRKSLGVRLTYRDPGRTLTDEELGPVRDSIAAAVADHLDGILRSG
ncbi:MAG: phenylalanine--tRNA ligase subunit beta [Acidimicrobiia bacterium]|nr:phenylalanine--tRNA ligase subunit beta [Acidimicrobiia bacterium]